MKTMPFLRLFALVLGLAVLVACAKTPVGKLPHLNLDPDRVTVTGLSSGAYMATQSHLAWPEIFSGAALVAGGPYACAQGDLARALSSCMKGKPAIDVDVLANEVRQRSANGALGPLTALAGDRIYVLHGRADQTVAEAVSRDAAALYRKLQAVQPSLEVEWDGARNFGHNLPLAATGDDCVTSKPPFLGHCGLDAAGEIFAQLYGTPKRQADTARGELRTFNQQAFVPGDADAYLADTGYVYLPRECLSGEKCGVLVAFHGCQQNAAAVGEKFVREAGFNRWADVYQVAVLYPQTRASYAPLNPKACWDWWGFSGKGYDTRQGVQQQWLIRALAALGVPHAVE